MDQFHVSTIERWTNRKFFSLFWEGDENESPTLSSLEVNCQKKFFSVNICYQFTWTYASWWMVGWTKKKKLFVKKWTFISCMSIYIFFFGNKKNLGKQRIDKIATIAFDKNNMKCIDMKIGKLCSNYDCYHGYYWWNNVSLEPKILDNNFIGISNSSILINTDRRKTLQFFTNIDFNSGDHIWNEINSNNK